MRKTCEHCGATYNIPEERLNKPVSRAKCKACGEIMVIRKVGVLADDDPTVARPASHDDPTVDAPHSRVATAQPSRSAPRRPESPKPGPSSPHAGPHVALLVIDQPGVATLRLPLPAGAYVVGSGQGSAITLHAHGVVDDHVLLTVMPDGMLVVQDQGGGIRLNGKGQALGYLREGDVLGVGEAVLRLEPIQPIDEPPSEDLSAPLHQVAHQPSPAPEPQRRQAEPAQRKAPPPAAPPAPPRRDRTAPPEHGHDFFGDEGDDDEIAFEAPFDLAAALLDEPVLQESELPREQHPAIHVVRFVDGRAQIAKVLRQGESFAAPSGRFRAEWTGGQAVLHAATGLTGKLVQGGQAFDLASAVEQQGWRSAAFAPGDAALVTEADTTYVVRVFWPVIPPKKGERVLTPSSVALTLVAILLHVAFAWVLGEVHPQTIDLKVEEEAETFAEVEMKPPDTPKPPAPPAPKRPEAPTTAKAMAEKAPTVSKRTVEKAQEQTTSANVNNLVKLLAKGSGKEGASNNLKDLVSNIDAVSGSAGGSASFNIAGAIGKLEGGGINIARSGGGGAISTMSGEDVKGGTVGEAKTGDVRGKVTSMASSAQATGGSLDKAEIARVVNQHMHEVQACYEKGLMSGGAASGKVNFDWTITLSGGVTGVRVRSSTLTNPAIAECISSKIKTWKFPQPQGGEVIVTYPFLFRSVGQ